MCIKLLKILGDVHVIPFGCDKRGGEEDGYLRLCGACQAIRRLPDTFFPPFINEVMCDDDKACLYFYDFRAFVFLLKLSRDCVHWTMYLFLCSYEDLIKLIYGYFEIQIHTVLSSFLSCNSQGFFWVTELLLNWVSHIKIMNRHFSSWKMYTETYEFRCVEERRYRWLSNMAKIQS